jgi:hypothetical protein
MKHIWCFALLVLVFLTTGICAAEVPDMRGIWTGSWNSYDEGKGFSNLTENASIIFTIEEQKGRIFTGNITFNPQSEIIASEGVAGAIGLDNKTLSIAEFDEGYALGTIISNDEIELIYLADGKNASVAIDRLYRTKARNV